MKYIATIRKVHLWLGLILAVFLLVEATTGLILSSPALIGANQAYHTASGTAQQQRHEKQVVPVNAGIGQANSELSADVSSLVFVKELHQGIIYNKNFRWIVEIIAVSIIVLTLTGIYLSIPFLKAQARKNGN